MDQQMQATPDDIDISQVLRALRRSLITLIGFSLLAGALAWIVLSLIAPRYESIAEIEVRARDSINPFVAPKQDGSGSQTLAARMDKQAVNTHVRAIQSTQIAAKIAEELSLHRLPEFNSAIGPVDTLDSMLRLVGIGGPRPGESIEDRVLDAYFRNLTVTTPEDSRAISVRFESTDPELAAQMANKLVEIYRARLASVTVVETDQLQKALAPRIEKLSDEVAKAEGEVARYRATTGLLRGGAQKTPLNDQQLGDLTAEMTKVAAARTAAEARARTARQLMRRGTPEVIPEVQRSPLIQNLIQQKVTVERDLRKFSASMKSAHPVMRQFRADLEAVRRQIAAEVANVVASLEKEAIVAQEQEAAIKNSLDQVKTKVADTGDEQVQLSRLEAVANSKRAELSRLQSQFEANRARADEGVIPVEAQIITKARPSGRPVSPKKGPWTALVMVAAFLVSLAWVVTRALFTSARQGNRPKAPAATVRAEPTMDRRKTDVSDGSLPAHLGADAVAAARKLDRASPADVAAGMANADEPGAALHTSTETLAATLLEGSSTTPAGFRTMIASHLSESETAEHLRKLAGELDAKGSNVIVVDWATNGRGVAAHLEVARTPGFNELLKGTTTFGDVVRLIPNSRVHCIPSGSAIAEGAAAMDADQLNLVLDALDEAYDQIIVVAATEDAQTLFEAIQGRFDAGITVEPAGHGVAPEALGPVATFLGFEVTDIELMTFRPTATLARSRMAIATRSRRGANGEGVSLN